MIYPKRYRNGYVDFKSESCFGTSPVERAYDALGLWKRMQDYYRKTLTVTGI